MISIHRAQVEDIMTIKKLLYETWVDTYGSYLSPQTIEEATSVWHYPDKLLKHILQPDSFMAVAKDKGKIVGVTSARKIDEKTILMHQLYVHPGYQQKAESLKTEVEEKNKKGLSFYLKKGFREVGRKDEKVVSESLAVIELEMKI